MRNFILFFAILFSACGHNGLKNFTASNSDPQVRRPASGPAGIWEIQGQHSMRGRYHGTLELRPKQNGQFDVIKIMNFQNFKFENSLIQEIWTGTASPSLNGVLIQFSLKQADFLNSANGQNRDPKFFNQNLKVQQEISFENLRSLPIQIGQDQYIENLTGDFRALGPVPTWEDQRRNVMSKGDKMPALVRAVRAMMIDSIVKDYRKDPTVASYANRKEFQDEVQYFIFDPTDFDFYRKNPDKLRIVNKVVDSISMIESNLRRMAYAPTLKNKADHFESDMMAYHINELGLFSSAEYDSEGKFTGFGSDGDGALWSGMYAGSQAMRYLATRDPQALDNFKKVLKGLMLLMDLTGTNEFARTAHPMKPNEVLQGNWQQGIAPYSHIKYLRGGNNDMIKGLFHGFIWASVVLPEQDPLRAELTSHAKRIPELEIAKSAKQNTYIANGIAALYTQESVYRQRYIDGYKWVQRPMDWLSVDGGFYYGGIADWSGINLGMTGTISEIMLAQEIARKFPSPKPSSFERITGQFTENDILNRTRESLMKQWDTYAETRRDFLTIAAYSFSYKAGTRGFGYSENGRSKEEAERTWEKREQWDRTLSQSIWALREIPTPRSEYNLNYDNTLRPDWCMSAWPRLPWKSVKQQQPWEYHYQGVYSYPAFENIALGSNWLWKDSPFPLKGSDSRNNRYAGGDYLYTYWMARMSGLLTEKDYQVSPNPEPNPPPPPVPTPTPAPKKYIEIQVGDGTVEKIYYKEFKYSIPNSSEPIHKIKFSSNKSDTRVEDFVIVFADNGEERSISQFKGVLHDQEVKLVDIENRPLSSIRLKAISAKVSGSRGEFRVELGVYR